MQTGTVGLVLGAVPTSGGGYVYEAKLKALLGDVCAALGLELRVFHSRHGQQLVEIVGDAFVKIGASGSPKRLGKCWRPFRKTSSSSFEVSRILEAEGVDLVYFASPNYVSESLLRVPFITTVWDLGHRDLPEFPEFRGENWQRREKLFQSTLPRAFHVFVDSASTANRLSQIYNVSGKRISSVGLLYDGRSQEVCKADLDQRPSRPYFVYPAKKWAHKNHVFLLEAFSLVVKKIPEARMVFCGAPGGGASRVVSARVDQLGLGDHVLEMGFVDNLTLEVLIDGAEAVVMPSLLGPTNIPPLQALAQGVVAIVSPCHEFDGLSNNRNLHVVPMEPKLWADAMLTAIETTPALPLQMDNSASRKEIQSVLSKFFEVRSAWLLPSGEKTTF